eukprot:Partr_v1_DN26518_c0_g1_i2_m3566 putative solute carrier family 33 (acetyl-CoA transporter), member 1
MPTTRRQAAERRAAVSTSNPSLDSNSAQMVNLSPPATRRLRSNNHSLVDMEMEPLRSSIPSGAVVSSPSAKLSIASDLPDIVLLIVLYLLQGIPLGLAMGSVPFVLKKQLSYAEIATFSLASYPYSLKLFWSPFVDSIFWREFGRRKSWIVPVQLAVAVFLFWIGHSIDGMLEGELDINYLTGLFVALVFLSATQDIAVDGWALELLAEENLSYASTCQTIGLNTGYFLSFTVLLALQSAGFCNSYLRSVPKEVGIITLGSYVTFWSYAFFAVTLWLLLFKRERHAVVNETIGKAYQDIWQVLRLPNMQSLVIVLLVCKLGFITNDSVTAFKLVENGFKEEELGLTALINFPLQIVFGYYAAKWSTGEHKLRPWVFGFYGRLAMALIGMIVVKWTESHSGSSLSSLIVVIACSVMSSFFSTIQFVSMGAFFANIADPLIGGTYMTLLNTISNFGGTYPQFFIFKAVDAGGYYAVSFVMVAIGLVSGLLIIMPRIYVLEALPVPSWRIH